MIATRNFRHSASAAVLLGLVALAACSDRTTGPTGGPQLRVRPFNPGTGTINPAPGTGNIAQTPKETLEICKYGSSATINVNEVQPSFTTSGSFALTSGQCMIVADFDGTQPANFTINESAIQAGFKFDSAVVRRRAPNGTVTSTKFAANNVTITGATKDEAYLVAFYNSASPPPPPPVRGCTFTQGYYKNHEEVVVSLLNGGTLPVGGSTIGGTQLTAAEIDQIYGTPPKGGNAELILLHQLITAKLNIIGGASAPGGIQADITRADQLLVGGISASERAEAIAISERLDAYNNGNAPGGPGHCS
ncbi:MAG: hypothetical protein WKG32_04385 [Gemmatimonadaceae bacterium]